MKRPSVCLTPEFNENHVDLFSYLTPEFNEDHILVGCGVPYNLHALNPRSVKDNHISTVTTLSFPCLFKSARLSFITWEWRWGQHY